MVISDISELEHDDPLKLWQNKCQLDRQPFRKILPMQILVQCSNGDFQTVSQGRWNKDHPTIGSTPKGI